MPNKREQKTKQDTAIKELIAAIQSKDSIRMEAAYQALKLIVNSQ